MTIGGTRWVFDNSVAAGELLDRSNFDMDEIGVRLSGTLKPKDAGAVVVIAERRDIVAYERRGNTLRP
jgi:hypothetical protein